MGTWIYGENTLKKLFCPMLYSWCNCGGHPCKALCKSTWPSEQSNGILMMKNIPSFLKYLLFLPFKLQESGLLDVTIHYKQSILKVSQSSFKFMESRIYKVGSWDKRIP